tara:strand:+ start:28379 stop:31756 length:3378 start_codon:yes stop_codon:yes gene_type:complete
MKKIVIALLLSSFCYPALAIDLDFYVYGDFDATVGAFRRAALIFADTDYAGLVFIVSVFGLFSGGVSLFWNGLFKGTDARRILGYVFYPFMGIALYVTAVMNTGTMHIYDETQNKYEAVGGVPDGIVLLAGAFNKYERIVSEVASDNPATVRSALASGTGIKAFLDAFAGNPLSDLPYLQKSLDNLVIDCIDLSMVSNPTLDLEYIRSQAANAMAVLAEIDSNAGSTITYDDNGNATTRTCATASANIQGRLTAANFDQATETLCLKAGYEIGGAGAAAERAACYTQLEGVAQVFLGAPFAAGTARELFTNIAVYNTISENINNANVTVNGLGSREIASEGIASLAVTEDWLPQIRGGMVVTILSLMVLIALFLVTPLFPKAMMVMFALFFFLAFWGAASSLQLANAYDQVIYAARSIAFHQGGLEAYLMAPTSAVAALAIIGDSLSTAMMFAAALTTIFTGVSAYGFSNALSHAAGKVEGIGDNQGKNLTMDGKAELVEKSANSMATMQVANAMGPNAYGQAHVQRGIESQVSAYNRAAAQSNLGESRMQVAAAEGLRQGGEATGSTDIPNPAQHGRDSASLKIGGEQSQIQRAQVAGNGDIIGGERALESIRNSGVSMTHNVHRGDINSADAMSTTEAQQAKGGAEGVRSIANKANVSVEDIGHRAGARTAAENAVSQELYPDDKLINVTRETGAHNKGQHAQTVEDAKTLFPGVSNREAMEGMGRLQTSLENNPTMAYQGIPRDDAILAEKDSQIDRIANAKMTQAVAREVYNDENPEITYDEWMKTKASMQPLFQMAMPGDKAIDIISASGSKVDTSWIDPNRTVDFQAATTLDENGDVAFGGIHVSQGSQVLINDNMDIREGTDMNVGDRTRAENNIEGNTLMNGAQTYDQNPGLFNFNMAQLAEMTEAERLSAFEELVSQSLPTSFYGESATHDSFSWSSGGEIRGGISTGILEQVGIDASAIASTSSFQDNIDSMDKSAHVKIGAIALNEKYEEVFTSTPPEDGRDPERLEVGDSYITDERNERFARHLQTLYNTSREEGTAALNESDVNQVNDYNSGKTGNIPMELNKAETKYYQSLGWDTHGPAQPLLTPQQQAAQVKQQEEYEALQKKVSTYRIN